MDYMIKDGKEAFKQSCSLDYKYVRFVIIVVIRLLIMVSNERPSISYFVLFIDQSNTYIK